MVRPPLSSADYERLVGQYRTSLQEGRRGETMRQIQDLLLDELPIMLLNYQVTNPFARKGVLHIAQRRLSGCAGVGASQTCARLRIALAQRFQPALGGLAESVDGGHGRLLPFCA